MKVFSKIGLSACLLMAAGLMYGCGDDNYTQTGSVTKAPVVGATVTFGNTGETAVTDANGKFVVKVPNVAMSSTGGNYYDMGTKTQRTAPAMKAPSGAANITALTTVIANAPDQASVNALIAAFQKLGLTSYDDPLDAVNSDGSNRSAMTINEIVGELINNNTVSTADVGAFLTSLVAQINALPANTNLSNPDNIVPAVNAAAATVPAVNTALTTAPPAGGTVLSNIVGTIKNIPVNTPITGATGGTGGGGTGGNF